MEYQNTLLSVIWTRVRCHNEFVSTSFPTKEAQETHKGEQPGL